MRLDAIRQTVRLRQKIHIAQAEHVVTELIRAAATAISAAGSLILKPPATFKKISRPDNGTPQRASRTAVSMARRPIPADNVTPWCGKRRGRHKRFDFHQNSRVPSKPANTAAPATFSRRSARNNRFILNSRPSLSSQIHLFRQWGQIA